jgi:peptidoglycan endopeptidase LytE
MITPCLKVKIILFQRDFFETQRRVFNHINFRIVNQIRYLPLDTVLQLLEYDISRKTPASFILTDGSEYVTIFRTTPYAFREGVKFRIDPIHQDQGVDYISFRSINRLFNSDVALNLPKKQVTLRQPGKGFITMPGDTLRTLSELLNASIQSIQAGNPNLNNPIPKGCKVVIPTIKLSPGTPAQRKQIHRAKVNQTDMHTDIAPSIIRLGRSLRGTPYQFGAAPYPRSRRFDCSSYMQYIFGRHGIRLPRNSRAQPVPVNL